MNAVDAVKRNGRPASDKGAAAAWPGPVLSGRDLLAPPEGLMWAVLERPATRAQRRDEALRYAFEPFAPAPIESLETRFTEAKSRGRIVACAVERDRLASWIELEGEDAVRSIRPAAFPDVVVRRLDGVTEQELAKLLRALELRTGRFEPRRAKRRRTIAAVSILGLLVASTALASVGMRRFGDRAQDEAAAANVATTALVASALGDPRGAEASLDPLLRLSAEVRRLEKTRNVVAEAILPEDRSAALIDLLAGFPSDVPTRIDQVVIEQDTLVVRGQVRDAADAERLRLALASSLVGWEEQSAATGRSRDAFAFTLALRRKSGDGATRETGVPMP